MTSHSDRSIFNTGQSIYRSGHYKVFHKAHNLRSNIALLRGNSFPACASCALPVHFQLTQGLTVESARARFRLLRDD
jgi:hypothetical protein